jgi:hypothetical protein
MTWGNLTRSNQKALFVTAFRDLGISEAQCSAFVQILLQKEITIEKFAIHTTGVKVAMTRKRKAAKRAVTLPPNLARLNNVDTSSAKEIVGWRKGVGSGNGSTSRCSTRVQHQEQILPAAPQPACEQNDPSNAGGATTVREIRKRLEANVAANDAILVKRRKAAGLNDVPKNVVNLWPYYKFGDPAYQHTRKNLKENVLGIPAYIDAVTDVTPNAKMLCAKMDIAAKVGYILFMRICVITILVTKRWWDLGHRSVHS